MAIKSIEVREKIIKRITPSDGVDVIPLFTYIPYQKLGYRIVSEYLTIENLTLKSFIDSLPVVDFPTFPIEASQSEIQMKTLELEWQSPRYHLNILISNDNTTWLKTDVFSILNSSPMPYREFSGGSHELGNNAMMGFQIQNVGYGIFNGSDIVNITADLVRTVTLEKIKEGFPSTKNLTALNVTQVLPEKSERDGFTISNSSDANIFLDIVNTVSLDEYMTMIEAGDYYESPFGITSPIYAISDANASLNIREFV